MASSAYTVGSVTNVYRWRFKDGAGSQDIRYMPVGASKTIRTNDILMYPTGTAIGPVEPYISASATDGNVKFAASGDTISGIAVAAMTTGGTVTNQDTVAMVPKGKIQILCRLVSNDTGGDDAAATSVSDSAKQKGRTMDDLYEVGLYAVGTGQDKYYPVIGDLTSGRDDIKIVEFATDSTVDDEYGLVWAELQ